MRQLLDDIKAQRDEAPSAAQDAERLLPAADRRAARGRRSLGARRRAAAPHDPVPDHEVHRHEAPGRQGRVHALPTRRAIGGQRQRHFLEDLEPWTTTRKSNIDFHHIAAAYDEIDEWFGEQANATTGRQSTSTHALSKWVYVIWYEAPSGTNPNDLFTRLNRDRIPLTDSELIKALVLSHSGAAAGQPGRQEEIAAQWDGFERDLRDDQFWAFLTGSTTRRPTHIDFLFESMTPAAGLRVRPRYWTSRRFATTSRARSGGILARRRRAARPAHRLVPRPRALPPDRVPRRDRRLGPRPDRGVPVADPLGVPRRPRRPDSPAARAVAR